MRDALAAVALNAPVRVRLGAPDTSRYTPHVETAVYFCCLEALSNVEKHAGENAIADVELREAGEALAFAVADDGEGFDAQCMNGPGSGLRNIRDRVAELGGAATVLGKPGVGTIVRGSIPLRI